MQNSDTTESPTSTYLPITAPGGIRTHDLRFREQWLGLVTPGLITHRARFRPLLSKPTLQKFTASRDSGVLAPPPHVFRVHHHSFLHSALRSLLERWPVSTSDRGSVSHTEEVGQCSSRAVLVCDTATKFALRAAHFLQNLSGSAIGFYAVAGHTEPRPMG